MDFCGAFDVVDGYCSKNDHVFLLNNKNNEGFQ